MSRALLRVVVAIWSLGCVGLSARGGAEAPCSDFGIYEGARVNTLVRQFTIIDHSIDDVGEAGKQLSRLVQLDALHSQIGFGPLASIFLRVDPWDEKQCQDDYILGRANSMLGDDRGLIYLSGYFQEFEGEVYLMTRLQISRKGREEEIVIQGSEGQELEFLGQLPLTRVSFSPRRFDVKELEALRESLERPLSIYPLPRGQGQPTELSLGQLENFWYSVLQVDGKWMEILSADEQYKGWIEVADRVGKAELRQLMPELHAVEAAAIYLQTRIAGTELTGPRRARHLRAFETNLNRFRDAAQSGGDQAAIGMLEAMLGALQLEAGDDPTGLASAREHFSRSAELLPANADALSLREISHMVESDPSGPTKTPEDFEQTLLRLVRLDPRNVALRANLEKAFLMRDRSGQVQLRPEPIQQLRERIKLDPKVQEKLKKQQ